MRSSFAPRRYNSLSLSPLTPSLPSLYICIWHSSWKNISKTLRLLTDRGQEAAFRHCSDSQTDRKQNSLGTPRLETRPVSKHAAWKHTLSTSPFSAASPTPSQYSHPGLHSPPQSSTSPLSTTPCTTHTPFFRCSEHSQEGNHNSRW